MAKSLSSSSPSDPKTILNGTGRIRSSRACLHCSRRKVKCDGLQPCNNCSKDSSACEYGVQKKRGPPKGCDPRGGRRKKAQGSPPEIKPTNTSIPAKRRAPSLSDKMSASRNPKLLHKTSAVDQPHVDNKASVSQRAATSSSGTRPLLVSTEGNGRTDADRPPQEPFIRDFYSSERTLDPAPASTNTLFPVRPSLGARSVSDDRTATPSHSVPYAYGAYDAQPTWSRPPYSQPSASSPLLPRHSSYLADTVPTAGASLSHPPTPNIHASQHTSADLAQHIFQSQQPQQLEHPQHHHFDYPRADRAWPSSTSEARFSQQQLTSPSQHYDAYSLQAPLRKQHRSSPQDTNRSMLAPHPTLSSASYSFPDVASQRLAERAPVGFASGRTTAGTSAPAFASPRSHTSRRHYDGPAGHYTPGTSPPSSSSLSSRHPVSASRLTEPATCSVPPGAQRAESTSHITGISASPTYTAASHAHSAFSTAMAHHPWHNGSLPHSPRDSASVPLSQVSSPGTHWLDHHVRPSPASANHSLTSSRLPLEDRLPHHIMQRLLDIYQVFVHPHWPILYLPSITSLNSLQRARPIVFEAILAVASNTFDAYSDSASKDGQQVTNPVLELLYAQSPQGSEAAWKSNELRDHFVHRVKTRIFKGKFAQDIGTIQAAILISVIELGCGNTSSAFQFGGIACRMALDMNLHRCTTQTSSSYSSSRAEAGPAGPATALPSAHVSTDQPSSGAQIQERLRVFWACYILDKILSTALNKPAQLRTAEIEADWPSVQEADEYDLWINETTRKFVDRSQLARLESVKVHALSSFKAWAEVMAILECILEEVYSPQAKRDRRRTKGASDYEALLRLNDRLAKWRANLPLHLRWSGTWTSPDMLSSATLHTQCAHRKESDPHRGLPPQILTMRAWYCICLILLHRPRVPKLLEGPAEQGALRSEVQEVAAQKSDETPITMKGRETVALGSRNGGQPSTNKDKCAEPAGLHICNAAAKEVCDILHVYGSSFRMRKISSSWVYLIFQSATIHAAIAASKSVVAFKARQSGVWSRRESNLVTNDLGPTVNEAQHDFDPSIVEGTVGGNASAPETHHVTEAELEGSSELVKTSARYLAECVRYLKRIGPTWQSATNHVSVLRNLCIASAQARPPSPSFTLAPVTHVSTRGKEPSHVEVKNEAKDGHVDSGGVPTSPQALSHTIKLLGDENRHLMVHAPKASIQGETLIQRQNGVGGTRHSSQAYASQEQHPYQVNGDRDLASQTGVVGPASSDTAMGGADGIPAQFSQTQSHAPANPQEAILTGPCDSGHQHLLEQQWQQSTYPINAYDSAFWASMPVASEGYNEWDEFFKAFNPSAGAADFGAHRNYHPTAAMDLITALQDPNRLLNTRQQQQH